MWTMGRKDKTQSLYLYFSFFSVKKESFIPNFIRHMFAKSVCYVLVCGDFFSFVSDSFYPFHPLFVSPSFFLPTCANYGPAPLGIS